MEGFLNRTTMLLGEERVAALAEQTVAIAGCGGVGGASAITLCRLGVGGFVLADPGRFDPPDGNRQWAASLAVQDRNKAEVHAEILRSINPRVRLQVETEGITEDNVDAVLEPCDLLLDCLDISVPLPLRTRVYRRAQELGMFGITAPIFGFGTMMVIARPDGMGMDAMIERFVEVASRESKLPPGFPDWFFQPHVDAVEREIHKHRVPTSSIAVTVATGFVCAEAARILLQDRYDDLPEPPALPDVVVIDPLRLHHRVLPYTDLFHPEAPSAEERATAIEAADHDVVRLPADAVDHDALSDSWYGHTPPALPTARMGASELLEARFGMPHTRVVFRGRHAEALVASVLLGEPGAVVTNGLFPTARHHIVDRGGRPTDLGSGDRGHLDLDATRLALASGDVRAIWLEPCNNSRCAAPLAEGHLAQVASLAREAGVPVVLCATRLHTNAVLLQRLGDARTVEAIVYAMCGHADVVVGSLAKDFPTARGALIGVRDADLAGALGSAVAMTGHGMTPTDLEGLAAALAAPLGVSERADAVASLAHVLGEAGVPVVHEDPGHGVFVDAEQLVLHSEHPAWAVCRAVYLHAGIRVAPNLAAPGHPSSVVRVALRVGTAAPDGPALAEAFLAARDAPNLELLPGGAFPPRFRVLP